MTNKIEWAKEDKIVMNQWPVKTANGLFILQYAKENVWSEFWSARIGPYTAIVQVGELAHTCKIYANDGVFNLFFMTRPIAVVWGVDLEDAKARVYAWIAENLREAMSQIKNIVDVVDALREPCPHCGQRDQGQTGEYPCLVCGLPQVWDQVIDTAQ